MRWAGRDIDMGQSEAGYLQEKLGTDTGSCTEEGRLARTLGVPSSGNPYLAVEHPPGQPGIAELLWVERCSAWWRGWDLEDSKRIAPARWQVSGESRDA
jgi:hypothetical protein